jgi:putative aldouronate transport system permease protein
MLVPSAVFLALFHFYPLWGISIAFTDYSPTRGVLGSEWVGLGNFQRFFAMSSSWSIFRNTLVIAVGKILFVQVTSILFALLLHEVRIPVFKRVVQTLSTLPHFLSWVIIGGIMVQLLSTSGSLNQLITTVGLRPVRFLGSTKVFPWTLILSETWKEFGFGAIIYLAALTNINPELYEAAAVDGAGRLARLRFITLPGISSIVVLMSCLSLGNVLNAGFEQVLVLLNPVVYSTGDILDTFVYRAGLLDQNYDLATAVGLVKSVIGFVLIVLSYWLADRFANYRVF